jgi:hypothetical protein
MKQWHPIFAQLLRPSVEAYYNVETTFPVGDAPRLADFVLLRRTARVTPPFHGLWQYLTVWNILEYKGPSASPRRGDIELLIELGLGIERRLRRDRGRRGVLPEAVSFSYLANHLGRRFLAEVERKLGPLEALGPGLWRCRLLGRLLFWVSSIDLPVEKDSLPLHIVGREPPATERQVAELVSEHADLQQLYGGWIFSLHPAAWKEVEAMARASGKSLQIDLRPAIEHLGLRRVIDQVGLDRVIEEYGEKEVIERIGKKELIKHIGIEDWLANLSPAERRELKRRLK